MSPEAREHSFDELTRGLANGTLSRGKALRLMGAALVGGALASIPGIALAEPKLKPDGAKCKRDSQCQSGQCASPESGGVCLPPPRSNLPTVLLSGRHHSRGVHLDTLLRHTRNLHYPVSKAQRQRVEFV